MSTGDTMYNFIINTIITIVLITLTISEKLNINTKDMNQVRLNVLSIINHKLIVREMQGINTIDINRVCLRAKIAVLDSDNDIRKRDGEFTMRATANTRSRKADTVVFPTCAGMAALSNTTEYTIVVD